MEAKRDDQEEFKHVCKLCNKRYPSGKSLGGHMRSHVIANSYVSNSSHKLKSKKKAPIFVTKLNGYGQDSTSIAHVQELRVCKQCGKGFQSLKALCGHMSCHSSKERRFSRLNGYDDDDDEDAEELWESEEEEKDEKEVDVVESMSNVCEIENEQEEVAICLMLLSRDYGHHNRKVDDVDNSVILEARHCMENLSKDEKNEDECAKRKGERIREVQCAEMDDSDSGYFENGARELESDDSVDWFARNYDRNIPMSKFGSGYDDLCDFEERNKKMQLRSRNLYEMSDGRKKLKQEFLSSSSQVRNKVYECWICEKRFKTHQALGGHIITHRRDKIGSRNDHEDLDSRLLSKSGSSIVIKSSTAKDVANGSKKTKGHECPFCPKVFKSGQALGGHKRSHLIGCSPQDKANLMLSVARNTTEESRESLDLNLPAPIEEDCVENSRFFRF